MNATEILVDEHRLITRALSALETATNRLKTGENVYLRFFTGSAFFMNGFTETFHHNKEEEVLFPALVAVGLSKESDPMATLLADHTESRRLTGLLQQMMERYRAGDEKARDGIIENAKRLTCLHRQHMESEDSILYPMAEELISAQEKHRIGAAFSRVEFSKFGENMQETYQGLVERLEKESLRSE